MCFVLQLDLVTDTQESLVHGSSGMAGSSSFVVFFVARFPSFSVVMVLAGSCNVFQYKNQASPTSQFKNNETCTLQNKIVYIHTERTIPHNMFLMSVDAVERVVRTQWTSFVASFGCLMFHCGTRVGSLSLSLSRPSST